MLTVETPAINTMCAWEPSTASTINLATAFLTLDLNAVVGGTMLVALTFSLANLAVDLVYAFLNPKITLAQP